MMFEIGDHVEVRGGHAPGHIRTPWFIRGKRGIVCDDLGRFKDPEYLAYGQQAPERSLLRVRFVMQEVFEDYDGPAGDQVVVDLFENWLKAGDKTHA